MKLFGTVNLLRAEVLGPWDLKEAGEGGRNSLEGGRVTEKVRICLLQAIRSKQQARVRGLGGGGSEGR